MDATNSITERLDRDGFAMVREFLDPGLVAQAHRELEVWFAHDRAERAARAIAEAHHVGAAGHTILTAPSHLMVDVYGKSPTLDRLVERVLSEPATAAAIESLGGKHVKVRGYNVRRMTGAYDPPPAHEWHRDSDGDFNLGILLTDVPEGNNAATALLPGSHEYPYCPRWNCLFSEPIRLAKDPARLCSKAFLRWSPFNRLLWSRLFRRATGGYGKRGDIYLFSNDTWHGREPNEQGREAMVCLIGLCGTEFSKADQPPAISTETRAALPRRLAELAVGPHSDNARRDTLIHRTLNRRRAPAPLSLFFWARLERRIAEWLTDRASRTTAHESAASVEGETLRDLLDVVVRAARSCVPRFARKKEATEESSEPSRKAA